MQWLSCGLRFSRRAPVLWSVVSLMEVLLVYLFGEVPILGDVVILFLAPAVLVSGMAATRGNAGTTGTPPKRDLKQRLASPLPAAFGVFTRGDDAVVIALVGLVAVAVGLLIQIIFQIAGGAAVAMPASFLEMSAINSLRYLGAYLLAWLVAAPLIVVFVYSLPLFFLEDVPLMDALDLAARALVKNGVALAPYVATLLAPLFVAGLALKLSHIVGLVLMPVAGFVTIPLFINSGYCSYKLTFH